MKSANPLNESRQGKATPIRTSIMEIIQELSRHTNDNNLIIAAVKNIFASHQVRLATSLVPLRLVEATVQAGTSMKRSRRRAR